MWRPTSEQEIVAAIEGGHLIENASFDAKAALPTQNRSKDLAKDVAAMANNGGILLYGVGEDEHGRPTVTQPFKLAGTRERVDQIVWSSISEPPIIEVHAIPTEDDPSLGYLVVVVPASPRAPHMVTVDGDNRFYGRRATGNVRLSEGEVEASYGERPSWPEMCKLWNDSPMTRPFEDWRDFRTNFVRGEKATLPRYKATDEQITEQVREASKRGEAVAFDSWASHVLAATVQQGTR